MCATANVQKFYRIMATPML